MRASKYRLFGVYPYPKNRDTLCQGITKVFCQAEDREYPAGIFLWQYPDDWTEQRIRKFEYNYSRSNPQGITPARMMEICEKHKFEFPKTEPHFLVDPCYPKDDGNWYFDMETRIGNPVFPITFAATKAEAEEFAFKHYPIRKKVGGKPIITPADFFGIEALSKEMRLKHICQHDEFWFKWLAPESWDEAKLARFWKMLSSPCPCGITREMMVDFWANG